MSNLWQGIMSSPTKNATNPSSEWRRMSEKILKTSTKANDSPPSDYSSTFEYQTDIESVLEFRVLNNAEQYLVAWKGGGNDLKSSWEPEAVVEAISKEALVKFWVRSALTSSSSTPEKDSIRNIMTKKLWNWTASGSTSMAFPNSPKKDIPSSPVLRATKRARYTEPTEIEKKPFNINLPIFPTIRATCNENDFKTAHPLALPDRMRNILDPQEFSELVGKPGYEIGELIPSCDTAEGNLDSAKSFTMLWLYVSQETPETLGLRDELKVASPQEDIIHVGRRRHETVSSVRMIHLKSFTNKIESEEDGRKGAGSALSDVSTHPPSFVSSASSESGESEVSVATHAPSLPEPGLMDFERHEETEGDHEIEEIATLKDADSQTDVLDPYTCTYCAGKRGEAERLSSLRQTRKATKKAEEEAKMISAVKQEAEKDEEEEDGEMVSIEYEIEKILDYRIEDGTDADEYYIRWKNYTADYDTWEPNSNLNSCDKALVTFYVSRAIERRNAEQELLKQNVNNGAVVPTITGVVDNSAPGKKKIILPSIPPVPEEVMKKLTGVNPISDGEIDMAFKLSKNAKKKSFWTKKKMIKTMMDIMGASAEKAAANTELPVLRHQILMIEAERRKDMTLRELKNWERQLNLIANGKPEIVVENLYDLAGPPQGFRYINDNVLGEDVVFPDHALEGCSCEDSCLKDKSRCCPGKHGKVLAYNSFKRLRVTPGYPIYECNRRCKCGPECANRVVQDGTVNLAGTKLCIFRTGNNRGWGVRTLKKIKKGTFVCLYAGEIITTDEAENRGLGYEKELGACYLFDLDYYAGDNDDTSPYTIDATKMGNISHFINHSCDPNLNVFNVWADCVDQNLPKLAFFALRDIQRDEELTYDYGSNDDNAASTDPPLQAFAPVEDVTPLPQAIDGKEIDETGSDIIIDSQVLFSDTSPAKNRMKPMSAVRRPCLCGAKNCRKILF